VQVEVYGIARIEGNLVFIYQTSYTVFIIKLFNSFQHSALLLEAFDH
jgi:hypothetical protein